MITLTITLADHPGIWVVHDMYCIFQHQRPTTGLPPDVLPLSGVLFSQSLMRPATPVFITAASCLNRAKSQLSAVVIVNRSMQEVPVNWALSSLSLSLLQSHSHTHTYRVSLTLSYLSPSCLFTLNVLPPLPGEVNTLPFSHMLLMFRMLSVTMGRSTAPERGDRDSLFSLCWDKVWVALQKAATILSNITKLFWVLRSVEIKHSCDLKKNKEWHTTLAPHWMLVCYQFRKLMQDTAWAFLGNVWGQTGGQSYF